MAEEEYDPYHDTTKFTNTMGTPGYSIMMGELTAQEMRRLRIENRYWRFYRGHQWEQTRPEGEPQNTLNYCRSFVDKGVAFLMGKGFNIDVPSKAREITKPILDEIWEDNEKELLSIDIAQSGGVTGNAYVKVTLEMFDEEEEPDRYEMWPNGRIRIMLLPSANVFPIWDAHDRDKMIKCRIIYPIFKEETGADGARHREKVWYKEVITKDKIQEFIDDDKVSERENPINTIPVVRIKNLPLAGSSYGTSDLSDIIPLQKEFNYKATDISDIINYHAGPITIVKGAKVSGLEKGARKVWGGLPENSDVYNLELESDLRAALDYLELVKESMFEIGNMPEDAFGGAETRVSNTSGVALHIKNQPLMEQTKVKHSTYGSGIKRINRLIIKYAKFIEYPGFDIGAWEELQPQYKYNSSISFPNPLPKDELVQMQLIAQRIKLMLMSRKDALIELGEEEPANKLKEIIEEAETIENMIYNGDIDEDALEALQVNIGGILNETEQADNGEEENED